MSPEFQNLDQVGKDAVMDMLNNVNPRLVLNGLPHLVQTEQEAIDGHLKMRNYFRLADEGKVIIPGYALALV